MNARFKRRKAPWAALASAVAIVLLGAGPGIAAVANDDPIQITQPNGDVFTAIIRGDEAQGWIETARGFTILQNPDTGAWEYARGTSGQRLILSGIVVDPDAPPPTDIPQHLRPPRDRSHDIKNPPEPSGPIITGVSLADWNPQPISGTRNLLVILVSFDNRALVTTANDWDAVIFNSSPGVKSVANFFEDNSFGQFSISPIAHTQGGPAGIVTVTIANDHPDYADNYTKATEAPWLNAALAEAAAFVDFVALDSNNDGFIQSTECVIYFIPAGYDASGTGKTPNVWAHAWSGNEVSVAGKTVPRWAMNGELNDADRRHPMGVIAHELGHQMCSLPDLYDTDYENDGLGGFSLMSFGSWGRASGETDNGTTPVSMDAWCRQYLGWSVVRKPVESMPVDFPPALDNPNSPLILSDTSLSTTQYWLAENRFSESWDLGLERWLGAGWGGGLLIQHIDITVGTPGDNDINVYRPAGHQGVVAEEASTANGSMLTVPPGSRADVTHLFYAGNNAGFLDSTTPNSRFYDGTVTNLGLCDISAPAETMTAYYVDCATASARACIFNDHDADGVRDPGEEGTFVDWQFEWSVGPTNSTATITSGRCADLYTDLPPCPLEVSLNVNLVDGKFDDPTGSGARWYLTTPETVTTNTECGETVTVEFGVVQLGKITAHKFDDSDMDGAQDPAEVNISGWPFRLTGTTISGDTLDLTGLTDADGDYVFEDLLPSDGTGYTVREDLAWEAVQPCADDPYVVQRASHAGKRWQATTPIETTTVLAEGAEETVVYGNVCLGSLTVCKFHDRNMSGSRQETAEPFADSNGNGKWDPAELFGDINKNGKWDPAEPYQDTNDSGYYDYGEPYTDTNRNKCYDSGEPLRDENGNGVWDPAEPWDDTFANGVWDDAEELLPDWPMAVCGTAADGRCIGPVTGTTDALGCTELEDLPPGDYKVFEDVEWCGTKIDWCDGGSAPPVDQRKTTQDGARWLATTDIAIDLQYPECAELDPVLFGNVKLAAISGVLSRQDCIGDPLSPVEGEEICLKIRYVEPSVTFTTLPLDATDPDCVALQDNCTLTKADGSYRFGELVPGVYQVRASSTDGFAPVGSAVDACVPFRLAAEDVTKDLLVRNIYAVCPVYQAYEGSSEEQRACFGYYALDADPITAVPGIFAIGPGDKWSNFVRATNSCAPFCVKDVQLNKQRAPLRQCSDVFPPLNIVQHGSRNVRTWWPLMYEPAGTRWTLSVLYTTYNPVQLDGETFKSVVHFDQWFWKVDVTLDSLDRLLDLFHVIPFGKDEVPLISSEDHYELLKRYMSLAKSASNDAQLAQVLADMELEVADMCIYVSPQLPYPSGNGRGLGIANTEENPACCKIMSDLDYLFWKIGAP